MAGISRFEARRETARGRERPAPADEHRPAGEAGEAAAPPLPRLGLDFPAVIDLASLEGTNGFRIDGIAPNDRSGNCVSPAGDVNGDGFDDIVIGAYFADPGGELAQRARTNPRLPPESQGRAKKRTRYAKNA